MAPDVRHWAKNVKLEPKPGYIVVQEFYWYDYREKVLFSFAVAFSVCIFLFFQVFAAFPGMRWLYIVASGTNQLGWLVNYQPVDQLDELWHSTTHEDMFSVSGFIVLKFFPLLELVFFGFGFICIFLWISGFPGNIDLVRCHLCKVEVDTVLEVSRKSWIHWATFFWFIASAMAVTPPRGIGLVFYTLNDGTMELGIFLSSLTCITTVLIWLFTL